LAVFICHIGMNSIRSVRGSSSLRDNSGEKYHCVVEVEVDTVHHGYEYEYYEQDDLGVVLD